MKLTAFPNKPLGWWSIGLILAMPIFFIIGSFGINLYEDVSAGSTILADIAARPMIAVPMLLAFFAGIAAFITGLITLLKDKERAILIFLSTALGFLTLLWVMAQFIFSY